MQKKRKADSGAPVAVKKQHVLLGAMDPVTITELRQHIERNAVLRIPHDKEISPLLEAFVLQHVPLHNVERWETMFRDYD